MEGKIIHGVCREPFSRNNVWLVKIHALRFVGGRECRPGDFPDDNGDVFSWVGQEIPRWLREGALCTLQVERATRYGKSGTCWYQSVRGSVQPVSAELIDLSSRFTCEDAWLNLREFSVDWPVPQRIYVRIREFVYGPFDIEQDGRRVYIAEKPQNDVYYRYQWSDIQAGLIRAVRTPQGHQRWIVEDEDTLQSLEKSPRDGRPPERLVRWYLRGLRDSGQVPDEIRVQLTRDAIRAASSSYAFFVGEPHLVSHRIQRLQVLGETFSHMLRNDSSIIEVALGQSAFEAAVQRRVEEVVRERATVIENQLQPLRLELERMLAERDGLNQELSTLQTQLAEERERFNRDVERQLQLLSQQKEHLLAERERLLRDFWVLSELLVGDHRADEVAASGVSSTERGLDSFFNQPTIASDEELVDEPRQYALQLLQVVGKDFTRLAVFEQLHDVVREHRLFALRGAHDMDWLQRYAMALGPATRVHRVVVEPGWINQEPLFGRVNPQTRRFEPSASGAFEFWIEAVEMHSRSVGGMQFLILSDANRSPMEVWLAKLLMKAAEPDSFPLALFHSRQLSADDKLTKYARLPWPENLRVVCVLASDPYSYEPSEAVIRRLPILSLSDEKPLPRSESAAMFKSVSVEAMLRWEWKSVLEALA